MPSISNSTHTSISNRRTICSGFAWQRGLTEPQIFTTDNRKRGRQSVHHFEHVDITHLGTMPSTHKKDKPWDTDDIDKWKVSP